MHLERLDWSLVVQLADMNLLVRRAGSKTFLWFPEEEKNRKRFCTGHGISYQDSSADFIILKTYERKPNTSRHQEQGPSEMQTVACSFLLLRPRLLSSWFIATWHWQCQWSLIMISWFNNHEMFVQKENLSTPALRMKFPVLFHFRAKIGPWQRDCRNDIWWLIGMQIYIWADNIPCDWSTFSTLCCPSVFSSLPVVLQILKSRWYKVEKVPQASLSNWRSSNFNLT